ncbi:MAG: HAD family hydrolase [Candidatus Heimdallarchaeota archaeon]|nr:MAG: HAD family hydrolase [Candidatus Heimdallarchaeota archaeon]
MTLKAILFDLDGTLVDTLRIFPQLIAQEFLESPNRRRVKNYLERIGRFYFRKNDTWNHSWFNPELFRAIRVDFDISWIRLIQGLSRVTWQFFKWDQEIHVFPGIPKTLRKLRLKGLKLGIVTNGSQRLLNKRFNPYLKYFDVLVDSKSIGYRKPSPQPLFYAIKKLNVSTNEVLFVGDTLVDLLAAKHARIEVILVKTGVFGLPPIEEAGYSPYAIISVVGDELLDLV